MPPSLENPFTPKSAIPTKRLFGSDNQSEKAKFGQSLRKKIETTKTKYGDFEILADQVKFLNKVEKLMITGRKTAINKEISEADAKKEIIKNILEVDKDGNIIKIKLFNFFMLELPKEIANLKKLEYLNIWGDFIYELPKEIGELKNLKLLAVEDCELAVLPEEITKLKNLQKLKLHNNEIQELPPDIDKLENLETIDLSLNSINDLPDNLSKLKNLKEIHLKENPLSSQKIQEFRKKFPNIKFIN